MTFQLEQLSLVFTDCMGSCSLYDVNLDVILAAAQLSLVPVFSQHSYGQPSQDSVKYPILFQWIPLYLNSFLLFATKNSHGEQDFFFFYLWYAIFWSSDANSWLTGKVPDAGKDWGQKEKRVSEDEMAGWHHQCNGYEFGQTSGDGEGQRGLACCSPWGHKKPDMTRWLNNNTCKTS